MNRHLHILLTVLLIIAPALLLVAQKPSLPTGFSEKLKNIDTYLDPYVQSLNFSGTVLIEKNNHVIFEKSYGLADREQGIQNALSTQFHIASMSMQFTAAAILRLVDAGQIGLNDHVSDFVPDMEHGNEIRILDLLNERSGLPDINSLPDYEELLKHHQTPQGLVAKVKGQPMLFPSGSKFMHEEHSAYNLLALIIEKKTGLSFAAAVERLVFSPLQMNASGADDDSVAHLSNLAKGYQPKGNYELMPANSIHWSAKTGNASIYLTAADEGRWVRKFFGGLAFSRPSQAAMLDTGFNVGYGWFKKRSKRFEQMSYYMNGRAPGFSSFVLVLPDSQTTIIVLSNIYSSATTTIGNDMAAIILGLPHQPFQPARPAPALNELKRYEGVFQFEANFYQPNAKIRLVAEGDQLNMVWPSGDMSSLIAVGPLHFIDRSYWVPVEIKLDASGRPVEMVYDDFRGICIERLPN